MKTLFLFGGIFVCLATSHAQQSVTPAELPPGPLIQLRAADFSAWIIRRVDDAPKDLPGVAKQPKLRWGSDVAITKTRDILRQSTLDEKGQNWNTWCVGVLQITIWPDGKGWIVQTPNPDSRLVTPLYTDYSKTDFPGFEWVSPTSFSGLQKVGDKQCLVFRGQVMVDPASPDIMAAAIASIDLETRLPVSLVIGNVANFYQFQAPPQAMLELPPIVQSLLRNLQESAKGATRRPGKPF